MANEVLPIQNMIYEIRGHKVMLDRDLAVLYGVELKVLNQAVKRNIDRFPDDFMFRLNQEERYILRSQIVTAKYIKNPFPFLCLYRTRRGNVSSSPSPIVITLFSIVIAAFYTPCARTASAAGQALALRAAFSARAKSATSCKSILSAATVRDPLQADSCSQG